MASEILVLEGSGQGNRSTFRVVFLFPIAVPIQTGSPLTDVVPTPITDADGVTPDWASKHLTNQEIGDLNGGALSFLTISFRKDPTLTNAQLAAELRKLYAEQLGVFSAGYALRYQHIGTRINA